MTGAARRSIYAVHDLVTLADLPMPETKRWVIRRKAAVVAAVRDGILSLKSACLRYMLSPEEYLSWEDIMTAMDRPLCGSHASMITELVPRPSQTNAD